ncbi:hypothetical protein C8R42DRAFT_679074 [Lentinula raphanica]|nr:hypothetical protein C8R42DRAFT_679074 [Lentinula raphanica]
MCFTIVNTKIYRCGATTGQMPAPSGASVILDRPAATSTRHPHQCRYMTQLHREYRGYSDSFQPHELHNCLPFTQWLAIIRNAPRCGTNELHESFQKHHYDCKLDEYGRSACLQRGTPHKYFRAAGTEPVSLNRWRYLWDNH